MSAGLDFSDSFVKLLVSGDRQAFGELVDRTSAKIFALGMRMLGNEQDAEDMLQETYLKAFKNLSGFEQRSSIGTWLFRIAANEALMILRKRKNDSNLVEIESEDADENTPREIVDWCCLPEEELASSETRQMMDQAAGTLSPALRIVFQLRDVEGFSGQETAEILGINEEAVKTRLVRARLKLREELSSYFHERVQIEKRNKNG
jgi:RNA polymerase sigma-70 factor (ECF subfamily)